MHWSFRFDCSTMTFKYIFCTTTSMLLNDLVVHRLLEYGAVFICGLLIGTISVILFTTNSSKSQHFGVTSKGQDTNIVNSTSEVPCLPKPSNVPRHIAVIMDGNRRYGKKVHGDPLRGHWVGGQTENWNREAVEIETLMSIFAKYSETLLKEATEKNVKVKVLSTDFQRLPKSMQESITKLESLTKDCTGFSLNICLSYGGRAEIVQACSAIASDVKEGRLSISCINEKLFSTYLTSFDIPDPDLLVRTSGETRLSNFLCWQLAYTELLFVPKMWPEFSRADLREALTVYSNRTRRFGM